MDHFEGVVREFLSSDRSMFIKEQCLLLLDDADVRGNRIKDRHWYCDVAAVNFRIRKVYLCEVTYSRTLYALLQRLTVWNSHWGTLCEAFVRDAGIDGPWTFQPWAFIPEDRHRRFVKKWNQIEAAANGSLSMPTPVVTYLEDVVPWKYSSSSRNPIEFQRTVQQFSKV